MTEALEDLFGPVGAELSGDEIQARWDELVSLNEVLKGSFLTFGNWGGDQLRIDATLVGISRRADGFVVLAIRDATWVHEGEGCTQEELTPSPFPYPELVFNPSEGYPEFFEDSGRIVQVNLPGPKLESFDIGFIWPKP